MQFLVAEQLYTHPRVSDILCLCPPYMQLTLCLFLDTGIENLQRAAIPIFRWAQFDKSPTCTESRDIFFVGVWVVELITLFTPTQVEVELG
jgi:hypothetical protein